MNADKLPGSILIRDMSRVPLQVSPLVLQAGLSNSELGGFVRLQAVFRHQETVGIEQFMEMFECSAERAAEINRRLIDLEVLSDADDDPDPMPELIPAQPKPKREPLVAPNPWPSYVGTGWFGPRDRWSKESAARNVPCVYFLMNADGQVLYVGSTIDLWNRFKGHEDKPWVKWSARPCQSRDDAYWIEAEEIVRYSPPLNRDRYLNGRAALVPVGVRRAATRRALAAQR